MKYARNAAYFLVWFALMMAAHALWVGFRNLGG